MFPRTLARQRPTPLVAPVRRPNLDGPWRSQASAGVPSQIVPALRALFCQRPIPPPARTRLPNNPAGGGWPAEIVESPPPDDSFSRGRSLYGDTLDSLAATV